MHYSLVFQSEFQGILGAYELRVLYNETTIESIVLSWDANIAERRKKRNVTIGEII